MVTGTALAGGVLILAGTLALPLALRDRKAEHRSAGTGLAVAGLALVYGSFLLLVAMVN